MSLGEFIEILERNNIPKDVKLLNDPEWEYGPTEVCELWYCEETNALALTQDTCDEDYVDKTHKRLKWIQLR
jgi:hypothetical protein